MLKVRLRCLPPALAPAARSHWRKMSSAVASSLSQLDGKPLQPPHFHDVSWKAFQTFSADDDPDRTRSYHWEEPRFLEAVDPRDRSQRTTVECFDVASVHGYRDGFSFASLVIGDGKQRLLPKIRDGMRMVHDSTLFASWLLEVLRPHLPPRLDAGRFRRSFPGGTTLSRINERCRFLCYTPGQKFKRHADGGEVWPRDARTGDLPLKELTLVTLQLYLHDVPPEHGGATSFIIGEQTSEEKIKCQPRAGSVLLFTQDLLHEGSELQQDFKYTMRSDVFYAL
eukprot:TRINITY_DN73242_c0_g1_i1.p1 TRINITY_DN73242_c0_g1~~TRINITY_DN73242_c0_g1_i1.p1  ORF type:complete len:282 (+),score=27.14 TRINITY_DN73242_c0_g1_i1:214-1059(+)